MGQNGSRPSNVAESGIAGRNATAVLPGQQHEWASSGRSPQQPPSARSEEPRYASVPAGAGDCVGSAMVGPGQVVSRVRSRSPTIVRREALLGRSIGEGTDPLFPARLWSELPDGRACPGPAGSLIARANPPQRPAAAATKRGTPDEGSPPARGSVEPKRLRPGSGPIPTLATPARGACAAGWLPLVVARPVPAMMSRPIPIVAAHPLYPPYADARAIAACPAISGANRKDPDRSRSLPVGVPSGATDAPVHRRSAVMEGEVFSAHAPKAAAAMIDLSCSPGKDINDSSQPNSLRMGRAAALMDMSCSPGREMNESPSDTASRDGSPLSIATAVPLLNCPASSSNDHARPLPQSEMRLPPAYLDAHPAACGSTPTLVGTEGFPLLSAHCLDPPPPRPMAPLRPCPTRSTSPFSSVHQPPVATGQSFLVRPDSALLARHDGSAFSRHHSEPARCPTESCSPQLSSARLASHSHRDAPPQPRVARFARLLGGGAEAHPGSAGDTRRGDPPPAAPPDDIAAAPGGIAAAPSGGISHAPGKVRPPSARAAARAAPPSHTPATLAGSAASAATPSPAIATPVAAAAPTLQSTFNWTPREDETILAGIERFGSKWDRIACRLPGRTSNAARHRHNRLLQLGREPDPELQAEMRAIWAADALRHADARNPTRSGMHLLRGVGSAAAGAVPVAVWSGCGGGGDGGAMAPGLAHVSLFSPGESAPAFAWPAVGACCGQGSLDTGLQAWSPQEGTTPLPQPYSCHRVGPLPLGAGRLRCVHRGMPVAPNQGGTVPPGQGHGLGWAGRLEESGWIRS
jgi:hypothetical protein